MDMIELLPPRWAETGPSARLRDEAATIRRGHMEYLRALAADLEAPLAARRFGTGWFAGFFALLLAFAGLSLVAALRWPGWFAMPELMPLQQWSGLRPLIHLVLLTAYGLALLSLLLRSKKTLGATALAVAIGASLLGGSNVRPEEAQSWG